MTLAEVARATREDIRINTFMLDATGYLRTFVEKMTQLNRGRAFFTTPETLGRLRAGRLPRPEAGPAPAGLGRLVSGLGRRRQSGGGSSGAGRRVRRQAPPFCERVSWYASDRRRLRPGRVRSWRCGCSGTVTSSRSSTRTPTPSAGCRTGGAARRSSASGSTATSCWQAGIEEANALAAVTSGDNSNILAARIARETFEIPHVVARIKSPSRAVIYQRLGIPTVATVSWTVDQVVRRLLPEEAVTAWTDPTGEINLVEHLLPESFCGRSYAELTDGEQFRPVLVTRGGQSRLVGPGTVGQEGDLVHFAVRTGAVGELDRRLADAEAGRGRPARPQGRSGRRGRVAGGPGRTPDRGSVVMNVGIAGGGVVGRSIARDLARNGHQVVIIESDPAVVAREQAPGCGSQLPLVHRGRLRGRHPAGRRLRRRRRGGGGHRRRRGQPGRVPAGQAGVRGAAGDRPGQPSRRTSGCSTRPGASMCRSRPRIS